MIKIKISWLKVVNHTTTVLFSKVYKFIILKVYNGFLVLLRFVIVACSWQRRELFRPLAVFKKWQKDIVLVQCSRGRSPYKQRKKQTQIFTDRLFKGNKRNIRNRHEILRKICSNLTIKKPGQRLVSLFLTLSIFHNFFLCFYR